MNFLEIILCTLIVIMAMIAILTVFGATIIVGLALIASREDL